MSAAAELQRGRDAHAAGEWSTAAQALSAADAHVPLDAPDLDLLAEALFMIGREDAHIATLERSHQQYVEAGALLQGASCAFWIGMRLFMGGEVGRGGGWHARCKRHGFVGRQAGAPA